MSLDHDLWLSSSGFFLEENYNDYAKDIDKFSIHKITTTFKLCIFILLKWSHDQTFNMQDCCNGILNFCGL